QAYDDRNRNLKLDRSEARAERTVSLTTPQDTQVVEFAALPFDSTAARLARAEARDSVEIHLIFDDYLDPDQRLRQIRFALFRLPDSTQVDNVRLLTVAGMDSLRTRRDSIAREAQARDTTGRAEAPPPPGPVRGVPNLSLSGRGSARPQVPQELVLLAPMTLSPGRYRAEVQGVRNIAGIAGGGGSVSFTLAARDTAGVRRDTIPTRRDTIPVRRDTVPVRGDPPPRAGRSR
ncbi:MAG TPA: hypothetical protein VK864_19415, partial [Longimicrobiales bacterium]|nr:hypothetical protein [Longimicrobiales bacterium]